MIAGTEARAGGRRRDRLIPSTSLIVGQEPAPFNDIYGAAHAYGLAFLFGNFGPSLFSNIANSTANRPGRLALSQAMMDSLGAFARQGDPNAPQALGVTWPIWPSKLIFDATPTAKTISVE